MRHGWKLLAVVLTGLVVAPAVQAQTKLRYKFKEGEKIVYGVDLDQKSATNLLGQDIDQTMKLAIELTWHTLKVDDQGNAQAKVSVSRVTMKLEGGPLGKIELDSKDTNEPENLFGQMFAGMVKAMASMEMTFSVDPTGAVTDAKVSQGKVKKMPNLGLGGDMFGPDTMKSTIQGSIIVPLPKEPIEKGKGWSHKSDEKTGMGRIISDTKFTYVGEVEKGGKKLEKIGISQPELKIEPGENAKLKVNLKKGSAKGNALFDNALGRIVEVNSTTTMQMEIEAAGVNADVNTTQNTTIRIKGPAKATEKTSPPPDSK